MSTKENPDSCEFNYGFWALKSAWWHGLTREKFICIRHLSYLSCAEGWAGLAAKRRAHLTGCLPACVSPYINEKEEMILNLDWAQILILLSTINDTFLFVSHISCLRSELYERPKETMQMLSRSLKPNYIWFGQFLWLPKCFWQPNIAHKSVNPEPGSLDWTPVLLFHSSAIPGSLTCVLITLLLCFKYFMLRTSRSHWEDSVN